MPLILWALLFANVASPVLSTPIAEAATIQPQTLETSDLQNIALSDAQKYGLNADHFIKVINCESGFDPDIIGDHGTSIGIAQLHYPGLWGISTSTAHDPRVSLEIMASAWKQNEESRWSCWTKLYGVAQS